MTENAFPPWMVWALMSAGFAALTAVLAKAGVEGIAADVATLIRTAIVFLLLLGLFLASGETLAPAAIPLKAWLFLVLSGLATGASWLCYFRALKLGPVSQVAPVDKLSVVLVALSGVAFLGERLSPAHWLGVALITGGVVLIAVK